MNVCSCGNIMVSNGKIWECPAAGRTTQFDKDGVHKGRIAIDKRLTVTDKATYGR